MNEVEKLYELAGVEKEFDYLECHRGTSSICCPLMDYESERDEQCEGCVNSSKMQEVYSYPEFTTEKQLAIIKWLLESYDIGFSQLGQRIDTSLDGANCIGGLGSGDTFEESLAQAINDLWQDLTEEERKQIKEILSE